MAIVVATLGITIACYLFGVLYAPRATDYREERQPPKTVDEVQKLFSPVSPVLPHMAHI